MFTDYDLAEYLARLDSAYCQYDTFGHLIPTQDCLNDARRVLESTHHGLPYALYQFSLCVPLGIAQGKRTV